MSFPTTITPSALPSLPLDERYDLPDTAAIYFVLADNTVLYIGQSINVRQRWAAHHRLKQLNERDGCRIAWMTVDDAGLLDELERACIAHFQPMLNGSDVLWPVEGNKPVTILFPPEIVTCVRALATQQATPFTILLRQWVVQRLEEEERERGRRL